MWKGKARDPLIGNSKDHLLLMHLQNGNWNWNIRMRFKMRGRKILCKGVNVVYPPHQCPQYSSFGIKSRSISLGHNTMYNHDLEFCCLEAGSCEMTDELIIRDLHLLLQVN